MNIKITKNGYLEIARPDIYKPQFCPYTQNPPDCISDRICGDWCPLFSEPRMDYIEICNGKKLTGDTIDQREI